MKRFILRPENRAALIPVIEQYLHNLNCDKPMVVEVKEYKRNRSVEQNSRLWSIYKIIGDELGYTVEEIHDLMRTMFLGRVVKEIAGQTVESLPSTTKLKVGEMCEYQEAIERWAGSMGIRLPAWGYDDA